MPFWQKKQNFQVRGQDWAIRTGTSWVRKNSETIWSHGHLQFQLSAEGSRVVPGAQYRGREDTGGLFMAPEMGAAGVGGGREAWDH